MLYSITLNNQGFNNQVHIAKPCLFAMLDLILSPISLTSFSVNLLFEVILSINSSSMACLNIALLAISLHLISLCFFTILWISCGNDNVMFGILFHLMCDM